MKKTEETEIKWSTETLTWEIGNRIIEIEEINKESIKELEEETLKPFFEIYGKQKAEQAIDRMVEVMEKDGWDVKRFAEQVKKEL